MPEVSPQPPHPPQISRRARLGALQLVGVPLLAVLPLLALFNAFGPASATTTATGPDLSLAVTHPSRVRHGAPTHLEVAATNTGQQPLPLVELRFDRAYLETFRDVAFTPEVARVTPDAMVVELRDLAPGESRSVRLEFTPAGYWRHGGAVTGSGQELEPVRAEVSTLVLP